MNNELMRKETQEAVIAGEQALQSLYAAKEKLNSAKNWGLFDLFGGGLFSDLMKHSKINDASALLEQARYDLQIFQRELSDLHLSRDLQIEIHGFLSFADFFFDGIIADYLVQSKINAAREQLDDTIRRVEFLLTNLKNQF